MKRILGDNLHWAIGKHSHFGFHQFGNCWKWRVSKTKFKPCTFYEFWRFFISVSTLLMMFALCGCGTTTTPQLTPALVEIAVQTGTAFGVEKYPQAVPALRVAAPVVCSAANGTNLAPAEITAALKAAGVGTNIEASIIVNGALAIYDTVFATYGSNWVTNQPSLSLYLKAVCDGLNAGLPSSTPMAGRGRTLPPHL